MRIAVQADSPARASGSADYARLLATELEARGHVRVAPGDPADVAIFSTAPYALGVYTGWLRGVLAARRLRRSARRFLVVAHEVYQPQPATGKGGLLFAAAQRWSAERLLALADATVVSDAWRASLLAQLVPGAPPPTVIPVGPNIPVPPAPRTRATHQVVLTFGLLQARRDLETLVDAFRLLLPRSPEIRLVIAGDLSGDARRLSALRARTAGLDGAIRFTGRITAEAAAAEFASARVFVTGYVDRVSVGSGTLAAALAYALPVIVYEGAALGRGLEDGVTVSSAPRTAVGLAATLEDALEGAADAIGARGRELYERELSWARIGDRYEQLLRTLAP